MNTPDANEVKIKEERLRSYLEKSGYDAAVIGRADNFAWITGGGENRVILTSEIGFSYIVITLEDKYLVSQVMDGDKVMDEELEGLGYKLVSLKWFEKSKEEKVLELVDGLKVISDIQLPNTEFNKNEFYKLHYPLTPSEIEKCRWLAKKTEEIVYEAALKIKPGMSEYKVQGMLAGMYAENDITVSVMLVGSDNRISSYRHCLPSDKKIEKVVLLSPAVRKWGLHANIARMVSIGKVPEDTSRRYDAVCEIESEAISMSTPGTRFSDILRKQKEMYKQLGYENEWQNHYQGGITGYMVSDPTLCMNESNTVQNCQAFDWFITITGAKGEELTLNCDGNIEVASVNGIWPTRSYSKKGKEIRLPKIMEI